MIWRVMRTPGEL